MSDKPRESFLSPEPVAYCYETPLHGWEIASRAAAAAEPELRWRAMVTLTDAEREAIDTAEASLLRESTDPHTPLPVRQRLGSAAAVLRGLLERLGLEK